MTQPLDLAYRVGGLHCASCANKVEQMATRLDGASDVSMNFTSETLRLRLDPERTKPATLEANLAELGYTATRLQDGDTLAYDIGGLDCASCAAKIEKMATSLPGASNIAVNFAAATLRIDLDENQTSRATLEERLKELGYEPTLQSDTDDDDAQDADQASWHKTASGRHFIITATIIALSYVGVLSGVEAADWGFVIATLFGVWPLAKRAVAMAKFGEYFSINTLVTLAALGAIFIGEAPEGAAVIIFFLLGEMLEGVAAGKARAGIRALAALAPKTAMLVENGTTREVPAKSLRIGQIVQVGPGARVPADGRILTGESGLDDSPVTGESIPVFKAPGDNVYAGSINTSATLTIEVEKEASDNTIARIIHLVQEAQSAKAPTARFIDRFSRYYSPLVVGFAALVAVLPPLVMGWTWHDSLYKGLALLLIGCPCALVLSVPAAITSAISAGTRHGLLIKGGAALEQLAHVKSVAFDKTGTLTNGNPIVTHVLPYDGERADVLRFASAVEASSSHPLARAILTAAETEGTPRLEATEAEAVAGKAVVATVQGRRMWVSSPTYAATMVALPNPDQITKLEEQGATVVVLHDENRALGLMAIRDEPRTDAAAAISNLKENDVHVVMLTGDNARTAGAIARDLGITVKADMLPHQKQAAIDALHQSGGVAMVGDGINDAPALALADVGIAMGGGTDVAIETSDATILREGVRGVADLIALARATMRNIWTNIGLALGIKALFLVTTLMGISNLWMAIFADTGATALVTANALRLLAWKPTTPPKNDNSGPHMPQPQTAHPTKA